MWSKSKLHISDSRCALPLRPLHLAARNGLATVVQALLSRGATVLAVDEEGKSCLNYVFPVVQRYGKCCVIWLILMTWKAECTYLF